MTRTRLAERGVLRRTNTRRDPDTTLSVEHRVVHVGLAVPDRLRPPIRRRDGHLLLRHWAGARVTECDWDTTRRMSLRIEHRHVVGACLEHGVERTIRIHSWIAAIGRDEIVQINFRICPVPHGDDDVALDSLRPRRSGRNFTRLYPVSPVCEHLERGPDSHPMGHPDHPAPSLANRQPVLPRFFGRRESPEVGMQLARSLAPHLVAAHARVLEKPHVIRLALERGIDPIPLRTSARKLTLGRNLDHREPVARRVILRRGARIRSLGRFQVQCFARLCFLPR